MNPLVRRNSFDHIIQKSWQSFSTMKRFVREAHRLENAIWRLWYMHRRTQQQQQQQQHDDDGRKNEHSTSSGSSIQDLLHEFRGREQVCVYCDLVPATYSCDGCCHDAYCSPCFQLVHKKGHLATHIAQQICCTLDQLSCGSTESTDDDSQLLQQHLRQEDLLVPEEDGTDVRRQQEHHAKTWEIKMDHVIKGLLDQSSLPLRDDLSVHAIAEKQQQQQQQRVMIQPAAAAAATTAAYPKRTFQSYMKTLENSVNPVPPPAPSLTTTATGREKTCGNCKADHMTFACPQLEASMAAVDVGLRRCFTTLHNDNQSNSTHAYLGDEISVHNGIQHAYPSQAVSRSIVSTGQSFLGEEGSQRRGKQGLFSADMFHESDDAVIQAATLLAKSANGSNQSYGRIQEGVPDQDHNVPVFPSVDEPAEVKANVEGRLRTPSEWILKSIHAEMDMSFCRKDLDDSDVYATWVVCRTCDSLWRSRFVVLYRNCIGEYLDESDCQRRPIGFCNLSNGSCSIDVLNDTLLVLSYFTTASALDGQARCMIRFKSAVEASDWKARFDYAIGLKLEDLFDLQPSIETKTDDGFSASKGLELGSGRFSVVRRARELHNGRDCALKVIDKNAFWALVENGTERDDTIFRETLTQGLLSSKLSSQKTSHGGGGRIVKLLSVFETQDMLVLELELMRGGDMFDVLAETGCITESKAAMLMAELIEAIRFCREHGVAHRDVKLSNLALTAPTVEQQQLMNPVDEEAAARGLQFGSLKLADFGMAALIQPDGTLRGRCGTPGYVAPEILLAGKHEAYSSSVDMFSAGVVLYTILCGYEPFYGVTDKELVLANKSGKFEFHDPEWTNISPQAKDLVSQMMACNATDRISPQDALRHPFLSEYAKKLNFI